jgi:glutaredoxin 3
MKSVTVYTTEPCARCINAKALLKKRGIAYQEVNLAKDPDGRAELSRRTGMMTFPQITVGEQTIGGLEELVAADRDGSLSAAVS